MNILVKGEEFIQGNDKIQIKNLKTTEKIFYVHIRWMLLRYMYNIQANL